LVYVEHLSGGHGLGHKTLEGELLLLEVVGTSVGDLEGSHGLGDLLLDLVLLATLELEGQGRVGDDLLNASDVGLKLLLGLEALAEGLVVGLELLGVRDHALNLVGRELANGVGDGDVGGAARGLLSGGDLKDTVDVDLEDDLEDSLTSPHRGDRSKGEFTQGGVVLAVDTLTLVNGELDGLLVVGNSGEGAFSEARNCVAARNDGGEDVALHGNTEGQGADVEQEKVGGLGGGGLAGEDTGLDGGTVGDGLVGVDALLELLAVEELGQELLDAGDTSRATDEDNLVNAALLNASVLEDLGNGLEGAVEGLGVQVLETGTGELSGVVLTIEERVDLNGGLGTAGESTLGALASSAKTTEGTGVAGEVLLGLALEVLLAVVQEVGVEVLTTQVGVTSSSLDGEDTTLDVEEGNIESTTTQVVDEDVALLARLAGTKTVGNGGSGRLVDDTEDVEASDGTSILGGLTLVVVEVGGDGDDSLLNLLADLDLGNLLHLEEDHGGDLLGGEGLGLAEVLDLDLGVAAVVDNLEGPGLDVLLDGGVIEAATDETLDIEDGVDGVHSSLVLGSLTDQTLLVGERNERRGGERTLLVGNDLDIGTLVRGNARVGGSQVNANGTIVNLVRHFERFRLDN